MKSTELLGNDNIKRAVSAMLESSKVAHSIVIYGDKGSGKKTAARYLGAALLCRSPENGKPCLECRDCRMVAHGGHPDLIEVAPSGKNGIYRLDSDLRPIISQAYIKPSEGRYKVAAIFDMDATSPNSQNALLKLAEEPPPHMIIIMTACSREYFLPTILSRVLQLRTELLSREDCRKAVENACGEEFSEEKFDSAFKAMGGNAGSCIEFIKGKSLSFSVDITAQMCRAVISRDEYGLMKALWRTDCDRNVFRQTLSLFSNCLRDCAVMASGAAETGAKMISCCAEETKRMAQVLGSRRAGELFELCENYIAKINGNAGVSLTINSFCAEVTDIL